MQNTTNYDKQCRNSYNNTINHAAEHIREEYLRRIDTDLTKNSMDADE